VATTGIVKARGMIGMEISIFNIAESGMTWVNDFQDDSASTIQAMSHLQIAH